MPGPGDQIGDFELIREISRGGVGVVYEARQISLDRPVALKLLFSADRGDEHWKDRFLAEAAEIAKLSHPGILHVHAMGEYEGQPWFAMELVNGRNLREALEAEGRFEPLDAAAIVRDAARALHHAHDTGLVHRDVKPENMMLRADGRVCVTDFGLAKRQNSMARTTTGALLGTPFYMSPEAIEGAADASGALVDVYGLGVTLYELLVGRPPYQSENVVDLLRQIVEGEPASPRSLVPDVPVALDAVALAAMAKRPADRPPSAAALADQLEAVIAAERPETGTISAPLPVTVRRKPGPLMVVGVVLALLLGVAAVVIAASGLLGATDPDDDGAAPVVADDGDPPDEGNGGDSKPTEAPTTAPDDPPAPSDPTPDEPTPDEPTTAPGNVPEPAVPEVRPPDPEPTKPTVLAALEDEFAAAHEVRVALASEEPDAIRMGWELLGGLLSSTVEMLGLDPAAIDAAPWGARDDAKLVVKSTTPGTTISVTIFGLPKPGTFEKFDAPITKAGLYRLVAEAEGHVRTIATVVLPPGMTAEVVLDLPSVGAGRAVGMTHYAGVWLPQGDAEPRVVRSPEIPPFFLQRDLFTRGQHVKTIAGEGDAEPPAELTEDELQAPATLSASECCDVAALRGGGVRLPSRVELRLATLLARFATLAGRVPARPSETAVTKLLEGEGLRDALHKVWWTTPDGRVHTFVVGDDSVPTEADGDVAAVRLALDAE